MEKYRPYIEDFFEDERLTELWVFLRWNLLSWRLTVLFRGHSMGKAVKSSWSQSCSWLTDTNVKQIFDGQVSSMVEEGNNYGTPLAGLFRQVISTYTPGSNRWLITYVRKDYFTWWNQGPTPGLEQTPVLRQKPLGYDIIWFCRT